MWSFTSEDDEKIMQEYSEILAKSRKVLFKSLIPHRDIEAIGLVRYPDLEKRMTRNNEWKITLRLRDPSSLGGDITVNIFNKDKDKLLVDVQDDDVIVIKNCKVVELNRARAITCSTGASFALFRGGETINQIDVAPANECQVSQDEMDAVHCLRRWANTRKQQHDQLLAPKKKRKIDRLVQTNGILDYEDTHFDFIGMVVDYVPTRSNFEKGAKAYLVLTDFTENPLPCKGLDDWEDLGIREDLLISTTLWDRHAIECKDWQFGDYVLVENLQKKTNFNYLEANLHGNRDERSYVQKIEEHDERLLPLLENKRKIEEQLEKKKLLESVNIRTKINSSLEKKDIKEILTQQTLTSFMTNGHISQFSPSDPGDWLSFHCSACLIWFDSEVCSDCQKNNNSLFKFEITLNSGDGSSITARVRGQDAADFLGITPEQLFVEPALLKKWEKIVRLLSSEDNPTFLEFGLEAYQGDDDDVNGKPTSYRVYKTQLIIEENEED